MKRERCRCCDYESWLRIVVKITIASEAYWFLLWLIMYINIILGDGYTWIFSPTYEGSVTTFGKNFAYVFAPMFIFLLMKMKAGWAWWRQDSREA